MISKAKMIEAIKENIPLPMYWLDIKQRYLGFNTLALKMSGISIDSVSTHQITPYKIFPKKIAEIIIDHHKKVIQMEKTLSFNELIQNVSTKKKQPIISKISPLLNDDGAIIGTVGVWLEQNCDQQQKTIFDYLSMIASFLPANVYWLDLDNIILGVNKRTLNAVGAHSCGELIGKTVYDLYPKKMADKISHHHTEAIKRQKTLQHEESIEDIRTGKFKHFSTIKSPVCDNRGKIIGTVGMSIDITDRKLLEEALKKSNTVKQEFIANMSHDLRTPITGIMGMLTDMLDCIAEIERKRDTENQLGSNHTTEFLEALLHKVENNSHVALGAVDGLLHLCNEILETVRLESHKEKILLEAFELKAVIDTIMQLVKPTAVEKKLTLSEKIDNKIPQYLFGSARYLSKSLLNLISNALKFTEKGSITVSAKLANSTNAKPKKGDKITLTICIDDTGIGIPKDKFETIFEHFSKLNPSYKGTYKGYGLGLYTVKRYVEAMRGTINVKSIVGKGTQFILTLPFTVDDHTDHIKPEIHKPIRFKTRPNVSDQTFNEEQPYDNTRVLLVEDTEMAATVARNMLKKCGCRSVIDWAQTGEIGFKKASENNYDLILMDIGLPKMQGTEVTEKIRALDDPIKAKVPIVALTGHADPEHKDAFQALGMNDLIIKPATDANIIRVLTAYVFPKCNVIQKDEPNKGTTTPLVFDWEASLKLDGVKNDENLLKEYLSLLSGELKPTKKILVESYNNKDEKMLRAELHRVRGALTYLVAPELNHTLKAFHQAVKATPQNPETLEQSYQAAIKAIDHFQQVYANGWQSFKQ